VIIQYCLYIAIIYDPEHIVGLTEKRHQLLVSTGFTVIGVFGYAELNIGDADIAEY
jgi:hypothetical protein